MSVLNVAKFFAQHPFSREKPLHALRRFARWQIGSRISLGATAVRFVDGARLLVEPGMAGATGNVYVGLHEVDDMGFLLHFLRVEDFFVDVGANVGSYTILASKAVGASCLSLEPVPSTFENLLDNIRLNDVAERVEARCIAAGRERGRLLFSTDRGPMNHVVAPDYPGARKEVEVAPLDEALAGLTPTAMKIDVEGFELEVVEGAEKVLRSSSLQTVVLESNGLDGRYETNTGRAHRLLLDAGLTPCSYDARSRRLSRLPAPLANSIYGNYLYVRDVAFAAARVASAKRFSVGDWSI